MLVRGLHNLTEAHKGCALTIGNFDGVHMAHRAVLEQLRGAAAGYPTMLMTFEPHPREYFSKETSPHRLTTLAEKLYRLQHTSLDYVLVARFRQQLATLEADRFVSEVLVDKLGVKVLVVGDDFRFGRGGQGDYTLLEKHAAKSGFEVYRQRTHEYEGRRISSTWVRECLSDGDIGKANLLLGEPYCIQGRVAHGRQLGRTIGFPTANINLSAHPPPISGVFAVLVHGLDGPPKPAVANLGRRPTVRGSGVTLEIHLFDTDLNLYGKRLRVELVERLREERKFDSLDALKAQIAADAQKARQLLSGSAGERA